MRNFALCLLLTGCAPQWAAPVVSPDVRSAITAQVAAQRMQRGDWVRFIYRACNEGYDAACDDLQADQAAAYEENR